MTKSKPASSVRAAALALLAAGSAFAQGQLVGWGGSASVVPVGSLLRFTDIAGGERHTVALRADGTVQAWGLNTSGQVTVPAGLAGVVQIAAGFNHSAALKGDGTVQCWGLNDWGQSSVPSGLSGVVQVSAGFRHTVAVKRDGTAAAWGHSLQTAVPANLVGVRQAAAGQYHTLVARSDGTVTGWGSNGSGQLTIPAGLSGVSQVAAGSTHSVALRAVGTVAAWGSAGNGQLDVPAGLTGVVQIAAVGTSLDGYSIALKSDGTAVAWGYGAAGQHVVPPGLVQVARISAGRLHGLALKRDGSIAGWGYAGDGQLSTPADVRGAIQASAGNEHVLALQSDGKVVAWGKNDYGQSVVPADLAGVIQVAAGARHSVALTSAGVLRSWGSNDSGQQNLSGAIGVSQIAAGTAHTVALFTDGQLQSRGLSAYDTPPAGLSGVTAIACGGLFTVTRKSDGTVVAWGVNTAGQCLGTSANGTAITIAATGQAVKILGTTLQGVTQIAAGYSHAVALRSNGTVVGWGDNSYGQCTTPAGLVGVAGIAVGSTNSHTVAIGPGGSVHAWGRNDSGQCNVPSSLTGVTQVSAGNNCTIALLPSGVGSCGNSAGAGSAALVVSGSAWQNVGIWSWSGGAGPQVPGLFTSVDLGTYGSVGSDCSAQALTLVARSGTSLLVPAAASAAGNDHSIRVGNSATLAGRLWLLGVSGSGSALPTDLNLPVLSAGTVIGNFDLIQSELPPPEGFFLTLVPESVNGRTVLSLRLLPLPGGAELAGASAGSFTGTAVAAETIDINHDGFDDLALAVSFGVGQPGLIQILLNDGLGNLGGSSVLETIPAQPTCLAVGDVNGDGRKDVVVGLASDSTARVYLDDGSAGLSPGTVISGIGGTPISVIVIPPAGSALRIGSASVGVGLSGSKLRIYQDSTLQQEVTLAGTAETVRGGNTGGAGGTDIVTGGSKSASINMLPVPETGFVQVLRRQPNGQYAIMQSMYITAKPVGMDVADLDGDGLDDIVTANADPQLPAAGSALPVLSIFRNTGGVFGGGVPYQPQGASGGLDVSLVDADADGDRDIVSVHRKVSTDSEAALLRVDTLGAGTPLSIGQTTVLDANDPILAARGDLDGIGGDDLYLVDTGGNYLTGGPQVRPYLGMPGARQGDLDGDGSVGPADVGLLLLDFGPCAGCPSDLDENGTVDNGDLSFLLLLFD